MSGSKNVSNIMIIIAICSIGGIIFGGNILLPKYQDFQDLNKEIKGKERVLQYKEEYYRNLQAVETDIRKYEPELAKIDIALPDDPSIPSLFDFLQRSCSQSGLVINSMGSFSIAASSRYTGLQDVSLSLGVSGPYESLKNLLNVLEKTSRLMDVESISFSPLADEQGSKSQSKDLFGYQLAIKVYSY